MGEKWSRFWISPRLRRRRDDEPPKYVVINAPMDEAKELFEEETGIDPDKVIHLSEVTVEEGVYKCEAESFAQVTGGDRGCEYHRPSKQWIEEPNADYYQTPDEFRERDDVVVIEPDGQE